nr:DUF5995 family protein [Kineococcus vitellinus]
MMHGDATAARVQELVLRFEAAHAELGPDDDQRHFCGLYLRSTRAMQRELEAGGFRDGAWVGDLVVVFATRYLDALRSWRAGAAVPLPWELALQPRPGVPPLVQQLVGLNAHLNFDLPQVLLEVLDDADVADAELMRRRAADFRHVDTVMLRRMPEESRRLRALGGPAAAELLSRLLYPLNLLASRHWLVQARVLVWHNAAELSRARAAGPDALRQRTTDLEVLCAAAVDEVLRPGLVLLRLARTGFGVRLPQRPQRATARPPAVPSADGPPAATPAAPPEPVRARR